MARKLAQEDIYSTLVMGFDAEIWFDDASDNIIHVRLLESGADVFETEIDTTGFFEEGEEIYTEDLINDAASAAVDLFEASRGTLGQGAGAEVEANMKKRSYFESLSWEEWYMSFKGTPFQEQSTTLLEQYLQSYTPTEQDDIDSQLNRLYREQAELEHRMDMLFFEKMKADTGRQTVIVVNAVKACFDSCGVEAWLNKFSGHKLEEQALAYAQTYLDLSAKIKTMHDNQEDTWSARSDIMFAMEELKLQALQQNIEINTPTEGPEIAPNMMNDMFELAEGVTFDEPLEPMSEALPETLVQEPASLYDEGVVAARRRAQDMTDRVSLRDLADCLQDEFRVKLPSGVEEARSVLEVEYPSTDWDLVSDEEIAQGIEFAFDFGQPNPYSNLAVKHAQTDTDTEREPVEVIEKGEMHEGLDPAEVEIDRAPFNVSESVTLSKEFEQTLWGGIRRTYPKGTKCVVDDLGDRQGNEYYLRVTEGDHTGRLFKVPFSYLTRQKKSQRRQRG